MAGGRFSALIERDVPVPMRDGIVLRADVWRPAEDGRYPILLQRLPYDKSATEVTSVHSGLDPLRATEEGFVVVIQDTRGRFASEGAFDPFRCEAADGVDTIAWAAALPYGNGSVGMFGGSYFGATQLLAACEAPPALKAIAPAITASDYYEGWTYHGGVLQLGFVLWWTLFALAPNEILRAPAAEQERLQAIWERLMEDPWQTLARLPLHDLDGLEQLLPWYLDWLEHECRDEWWEEVAPNERYDTIGVPALHIGGWHDIFVAGTVENFVRLRQEAATAEARAGQQLVVGAWSHANYSDTVGSVYSGHRAPWGALDSTAMQLTFFGQHLRGDPAPQTPRVRVFLMGANQWLEEDDWPLAGIREERWHLHDGGLLDRADPRPDEPPDEFVYDPADPVPTLGGATLLPGFERGYRTGPHDQRDVETRPDVLVYTSAPLDSHLDVIGPVKATLHVSSTAPATDFTAKLVDVQPDGRALLVCDGITTVALPDDREATVIVALGPTANRFQRGHRLRLELSSSNFPRFARNPNSGVPRARATAADLRPARQTVFHDAARPSHLLVPVRR